MQESDYHWFLNHYDEMYQQYGECYVAIKNIRFLVYILPFSKGLKKQTKLKLLAHTLCNTAMVTSVDTLSIFLRSGLLFNKGRLQQWY